MATSPFGSSELILNSNGSIYHLALRPEQLADIVLTVGDPDRVKRISDRFDRVDHKVQKREFVTHTGELNGKRLTVISTGIGPDNIDIVLNELDALANIDFETRLTKATPRQLTFIRIGTSGSLRADIPVDSMVASSAGCGLDNLISFYTTPLCENAQKLRQNWADEQLFRNVPLPYAAVADEKLLTNIARGWIQGITLTCAGFYAPQGRQLRLKSRINVELFDRLRAYEWQQYRFTNLEMETAAIYGLSDLMGHRALSCNVILANRANRTFSKQPHKIVGKLITKVLERVTSEEL